MTKSHVLKTLKNYWTEIISKEIECTEKKKKKKKKKEKKRKKIN